MKRSRMILFFFLAFSALLFTACARAPAAAPKEKPAAIAPIAGTGFNRVTLTEKAAQRIGIQTALVSQQLVTRKQTTGGVVINPEVILASTTTSTTPVLVEVVLNKSDFDAIDRKSAASIRAFGNAGSAGWSARVFEAPSTNGVKSTSVDSILYLQVDEANTSLAQGQHVVVELTLKGNGMQRMAIPYAALIYGLKGETWVYTNPEPLAYIRQEVVVDYIDRDFVIISKGPAIGTAVVTAGAAELYGAETGVGK